MTLSKHLESFRNNLSVDGLFFFVIIVVSLVLIILTKRQPHKMVKRTETICRLLPSVFDHFVGLALKGLKVSTLTLSRIMLKNGQTYFKNLAVFTAQDFQSMFDHFSASCMKGLRKDIFYVGPRTS